MKKRLPSYSEMLELFGLRSKNSIHKIMKKMVLEEQLKQDRSGKFSPGKFFWSTRVLGEIEAGFPSPAEEELTDTMSLDEFLIENKEATYLLRVKGESMIEAGIMPGDMVLVERGKDPKDGDIIVAQIDDGWTMKYFRKQGKKVWLQPANKKFKNIYPQEELNVSAIVRSVIRKY